MKILLFILPCVALCLGSSVPVIKNTRAEGCIDGVCNAHCKYEGNRIFPGDQLNEHGKCRMLKCTSGFDIHITPCPHDGLYKICRFVSQNIKLFFQKLDFTNGSSLIIQKPILNAVEPRKRSFESETLDNHTPSILSRLKLFTSSADFFVFQIFFSKLYCVLAFVRDFAICMH